MWLIMFSPGVVLAGGRVKGLSGVTWQSWCRMVEGWWKYHNAHISYGCHDDEGDIPNMVIPNMWNHIIYYIYTYHHICLYNLI